MSSSNRSVVITGSSSGIGLEVARAFLEQGANVVLNGRDPGRLAAVAASLGSSDRVAWIPGDIGRRQTGEALVRTSIERFGSVDVLVNNAGTFAPKPFLDVTEEDLDGYLDGTSRGPISPRRRQFAR